MKNFKKFITLSLAIFLFFSNIFAANPSLNEELSENTKHNLQVINQLPGEMWTHIRTFLFLQDGGHLAQTCKSLKDLERTVPITLRLTGTHLTRFNTLLEYLSNHKVVNLDLSYTEINDTQLTYILNEIGRNLRILWLGGCENLNNFEAIKNCTNLQELDLFGTNITDDQLEEIISQIGGNLETLIFHDCPYLNNYKEMKNLDRKRN